MKLSTIISFALVCLMSQCLGQILSHVWREKTEQIDKGYWYNSSPEIFKKQHYQFPSSAIEISAT
jgi:hypothetical protein